VSDKENRRWPCEIGFPKAVHMDEIGLEFAGNPQERAVRALDAEPLRVKPFQFQISDLKV
jgi:hypothetical protein